MQLLVDATPLYDLGQIGSLELLAVPGGTLVIPQAVIDEITVEPAATNLERFCTEFEVTTSPGVDRWRADARQLLDAEGDTSDVAIVACLLRARENGEAIALVSDDRRMRAVADGLGATVTGTFGIVVRASLEDKYFSPEQAKRVLRRTDHHGVQMTGTLRERAIGEVD